MSEPNINNKFVNYLIISVVALIILCVISLSLGQYDVSIVKIIDVIIDKLTFTNAYDNTIVSQVVFGIRLPRIVMAGLVGAALALSGAALQGTFRNPLVSPDLLGVCSGAGFGAALGILIFNSIGFKTAILSLFFGLASIGMVFFFAGKRRNTDILSTIMAGIITSSVFTALIGLIKFVADTDEQLPAITFWLMGSFANIDINKVIIGSVPIIIGVTIILILRWRINLLSLGDEECRALGLNPVKTRWAVIISTAIATAGCVMVSGIIGWVGLVIPHITRKLIGPNHGYSLPLCCLIGAAFMILIDTIARNITVAEVPIGILTALIGAPFFMIIYNKTREE